MTRIAILIGVYLWIWTASALAQSAERSAVVAKAGDVYVTEKELVERFELLPSLYRNTKSRLQQAKLELVYSLIAEKLLAQEALERELDRDSLLISAYEDVRKMLARDRLYREEVGGKVTVTPKEIERVIAQAQNELFVSFLFFERREDAEFVRRQLVKAADFETIQVDSSLRAVRDTATVTWGDAEPTIERAAYALNKGEISPVVPAGNGYYILRLSGVQRSSYYTSLQPSESRERVASKLRERKEEVRMDEFTRELFRSKSGYSRPAEFTRLARALTQAFEKDTVTGRLFFTESKMKEVREQCGPWLSDSLSLAERYVWTVEAIIEQLFVKGFSLERDRVREIPRLLNKQLQVLVQQELLAQEALQRGVDKRPDVQRQLEMWYQSILAHAMKQYVQKHAIVTDAEVWTYLQSKNQQVAIPKVQIRELQTGSLEDMSDALTELQHGRSFEEIIERWSNDATLRARKGLSDPFPISERYPVGEIAWQMAVGQRYGPLKVARGYLYF
ncbi:MAG: peptidyl-prolyl cis-trans isomerase, partial [Bacteroidota bacterium]